jgi:hypothetical protein
MADSTQGTGPLTLSSFYDLTNKAHRLEREASNLKSSISNVSVAETSILTQQENVQKILEREYSRLKLADSNIAGPLQESQIRISELNRSYVARNYAFISILISLGITLGLLVILMIMSRRLHTIPDSLVNTLMIIVLCVGLIFVGRQIIAFNQRDPSNFLKLKQPPAPPAPSSGGSSQTSSSTSSTSGGLSCSNSACCSTGTTFNSTLGICQIPDTSIPSIAGNPLAPIVNRFAGSLYNPIESFVNSTKLQFLLL